MCINLYKNHLLSLIVISFFAFLTSCTFPSNKLAPKKEDLYAKQFQTIQDQSIIYIYRFESYGSEEPLQLRLNHKQMGKTAGRTYFRWQVPPGKHIINSRADNNEVLSLTTEPNKIYFVRQDLHWRRDSPITKLRIIDNEVGMQQVEYCRLLTTTTDD